MPKKLSSKTSTRLDETPEGKALLAVVARYGSPQAMAKSLDIDPQHIRQWLYRGRMSKHGALKIAETELHTKEELRPDLSEGDWGKLPVGAAPHKQPVATTEDAKLLVRLAEQHGSVKDLCAKAFCTVSDYHTWKSRGRIPAIKLPTFLGLQQ